MKSPLGPLYRWCSPLVEHWSRRWSGVLRRRTKLRRLSKVVLEGEEGCPDAELPRRRLHDAGIASAYPESVGVERIREAHADARLVPVELLANREVGHLEARELTALDL